MLQQMQSGKVENATENSLITHGYDKDTVKEMTEEEKITVFENRIFQDHCKNLVEMDYLQSPLKLILHPIL